VLKANEEGIRRPLFGTNSSALFSEQSERITKGIKP
jgi:hypothetical protein